jgi:hypothetical protein
MSAIDPLSFDALRTTPSPPPRARKSRLGSSVGQ